MNTVNELDEFNFYPTLEETAGVVLVFFSGPHCASCHYLKALLTAEFARFEQHFAERNRCFSAFEVKADKATALVNEYAVFHLPSMFLFKDGEFHCALQAEAIPSKLLAAMDSALAQAPQEAP